MCQNNQFSWSDPARAHAHCLYATRAQFKSTLNDEFVSVNPNSRFSTDMTRALSYSHLIVKTTYFISHLRYVKYTIFVT